MKINVDSDGCAAGFDEKFIELFGSHPKTIPDDKLWDMIHSVPDFFISLPVLSDFHALWAVIQPLNPTVITGIPRDNIEHCAAQKRAWWKLHFNHDNVITCLSKHKPDHMQEPGDILIDDMVKNCKRWVKAGGNAILYRTAAQAIADLHSQTFFQIRRG